MKKILEYKILEIGPYTLSVYNLAALLILIITVWIMLKAFKIFITNNRKLRKSKKYAVYQIIKYLMVATSIGLILCSNRFADKMVDTKDDKSTKQNISSLELQTIAFAIVGLVLLIMSFPKMMQIGWNVHVIKSAGDQRNLTEIIRNTWSFALSTGVQFVIGFILFIGSEIFSSLWYKAVKRLRYERNIT